MQLTAFWVKATLLARPARHDEEATLQVVHQERKVGLRASGKLWALRVQTATVRELPWRLWPSRAFAPQDFR